MSTPNTWTEFLALSEVLDFNDLYETRIDNDVNGKILYIGYNMTPNADPDAQTWYLLKCEYDVNGFMDRKRLPDNGGAFLYSYTDRAAAFS